MLRRIFVALFVISLSVRSSLAQAKRPFTFEDMMLAQAHR